MQWLPNAAHKFHLVMKNTPLKTDLCVDVQGQGKDAGNPLTVYWIGVGEHSGLHQAFHFKNPAGSKLAQTTFQMAPAHTGPQGGNKLVSFSASNDVQLVNYGGPNQHKFYLLPQNDGSVRIKSATAELFVTAEPKGMGKVFMSKLIVPENHGKFYQKFWLIPFGEYVHD